MAVTVLNILGVAAGCVMTVALAVLLFYWIRTENHSESRFPDDHAPRA
ncbi:MAG: hypothetical protein AB7N71_01990 [Phycisphaerae bacterium]